MIATARARDRRKRHEIARAQRRRAGIDDGHAIVRVHGRRAVTGEMLVARQHAAPLQTAGQRSAQRSDALRVRAEGARADHGIFRIEREIEHRRKIHRRAGAAQVERHLLAGAQC